MTNYVCVCTLDSSQVVTVSPCYMGIVVKDFNQITQQNKYTSVTPTEMLNVRII